MLQTRLLPAPERAEWLRAEWLRVGAGRRALAVGLALLIEGLLLLLFLSLGAERTEREEEQRTTVVSIAGERVPEPAAEEGRPERAERAQERPSPQRPAAERPPTRHSADAPAAQQAAPAPRPAETPTAERTPLLDFSWKMNRSAPAGRPGSAGPGPGPPAPAGGSASPLDSERVGTAPNGEPLYAASWYQRPRPGQLRGYLATANGPGWGLIACRTAPNYRVEDCVALDEYPAGSQINRAILAAAWEFKVRPPRLGGRSLVGSWVRIRIDYGIEHR